MSLELLQLGNTSIQVTDDEFAHGWQVGYLHFKTDFQDKVQITDELLCTIVAHAFIDVHHTSRCNAGYLVGFISALQEKTPKKARSFLQVIGEISIQQAEGFSCNG
jgi:hypothetical protein